MSLPEYTKIDMETYPRRTHYEYFTKVLPCGNNITSRLDVTNALAVAHRMNVKFYACMIYAIAKTVNSMDNMRYMENEDGDLGVWKVSNPVFTIFHKDDCTFSDLWVEYLENFEAFNARLGWVMKEFGEIHEEKARPDQPANFFCISCIPWMDYTAYNAYNIGAAPAMFPIVVYGKYTQGADGKYTLPFTLSTNHAACDGYHAYLFFRKVQEELDALGM